MGLLDTEVAKWKRAFGLLGGIPKTFKNNPRNAETMDAVFGFGGIIPGIGDAVSAAEAKYRYDQGDMLGAGLAGLGALPMVPALAGTFIGKKGINNLGLADVLKQAEAMEKAGKSRDEIWEATAQMAAKKGVPGGGIGRGVDKQWRFELDDSKSAMESGGRYFGTKGGGGKANQVLEHNDLFKAYPEVGNINTNYNFEVQKHGGSFNGNFIRVDAPMGYQSAKDTTLHELQHAIQQREGLARGGSPDLFDAGPMFSGKANELASDLSQNLTGGLSAKPQEIVAAVKYGDPKELAAIAQKHGFGSIDDALKFLSAEDVKRTPFGQYQRLAGEAEARLTQSRMNMTPLDRQMFPPWSQKELGGYDVPESQQIVRFGDGPAMSTGRPRNHLGQEIHPTPYELAHAEAQRVAALPVEQGGLGLPPDNTYIDRANAMYPTDAYHGTSHDIKAADYAYSGGGNDQYGSAALYTATDPYSASGYAMQNPEGANVIPLKLDAINYLPNDFEKELTAKQIRSFIDKSTDKDALYNFGDVDYEGKQKVINNAVGIYKNVGQQELLNQLNMLNNDFYRGNPEAFNKTATDILGYKGVSADVGSGNKFLMPWEPKNIRSRFAAFNPAKRDSADLLAGIAPWALPVGATLLGGSFLLPPEEY